MIKYPDPLITDYKLNGAWIYSYLRSYQYIRNNYYLSICQIFKIKLSQRRVCHLSSLFPNNQHYFLQSSLLERLSPNVSSTHVSFAPFTTLDMQYLLILTFFAFAFAMNRPRDYTDANEFGERKDTWYKSVLGYFAGSASGTCQNPWTMSQTAEFPFQQTSRSTKIRLMSNCGLRTNVLIITNLLRISKDYCWYELCLDEIITTQSFVVGKRVTKQYQIPGTGRYR